MKSKTSTIPGAMADSIKVGARPLTVRSEDIVACRDYPALVDLFQTFAAGYGGVASIAYEFRFDNGTDPYPWAPLFSTFPGEIEAFYSDNACLVHDPIVRKALSSNHPIGFLDHLQSFDPCPLIRELFALMGDHGIRDGLSMQVVGRLGQPIYVSIAFACPIAGLSEVDRRRIHAYASMFIRHGELLRPEPEHGRLSAKERQVVRLIAKGASHKEIARLLGMSPNTVRTHIERSFSKLGVRSRTQAALSAARHGHDMLL